jgi:hypothetical protein
MTTNHELARVAAENERLARQAMAMIQAADLSIGGGIKIIADTYAEAMAELERLKRQVAFVKQGSLLAIPSPFGTPSEIRCLLCKNTWWHECRPNHAADCPNNEANQ